jgi:hypothetical protein
VIENEAGQEFVGEQLSPNNEGRSFAQAGYSRQKVHLDEGKISVFQHTKGRRLEIVSSALS